jgi:type II secretory pathway predicted ATPase ExeA
MLYKHFNLVEEPFGVTPDPRFLYMGSQHREALASLLHGTYNNRGFLALIAKPGMGKTSLLYSYLEALRGKARTAFVFRTDCDSREFIRHVLIDLGIDAVGKDLPTMHEALNQVLAQEMRAGRRFVLVIDEAQNLGEGVLESVRLLSNFETPWMKLMQIVIAGQPGLAETLIRPSLAQLRQRISVVTKLDPLKEKEVDEYINHRLWVAGCESQQLFTVGARALIAEHSEGTPRRINNICFNAMSLACALKQKTVERSTVLEVLKDLQLESLVERAPLATEAQNEGPNRIKDLPRSPRKTLRFPRWAAGLAVVCAFVLTVNSGPQRREVRASSIPETIDNLAVGETAVPAQMRATSAAVGSAPESEPRSVRILRGETLNRISVENLGRYDMQILEEIRSLNPGLSDPDRIRAGQQIVIPSAYLWGTKDHGASSQRFSSSLLEVGKE